ncbi:MAG: sialate O-acetylesterase [Fibrobacteres bacterium]|nr:sialate O-acetylesterase [Fibrobacterota bacterium]
MVVIIFLMAVFASALELPSIFSSHMVLQREFNTPIWGKASTGEKITVSISNQTKTALTGQDSSWSVNLDSMKAGGPFVLTVKGKKDKKVFNDIMIGDVWLCSGQSNMWMPVKNLKNIPDSNAPAENSSLRLYSVWSPENSEYGQPLKWTKCTKEAALSFSAVGYYFGKNLQPSAGVTVGLIYNAMGGSVPEAWLPRSYLEQNPKLRPIINFWDSIIVKYPNAEKIFYDSCLNKIRANALNGKVDSSLLEKNKILPFFTKALRFYMFFPEILYKNQLEPILPFGLKGVVWYQGESSAERAAQYSELFPLMINGWRKLFKQDNLPFVFTQLPNYAIKGTSWPELRDAQNKTLSLPNTSMAVTIDLGELKDIHPNNKWDVGRRLALTALNNVYKLPVAATGPVLGNMEIKNDTVILTFNNAEKGLIVKCDSIHSFTVAGNDKVFYQAKAVVEKNRVILNTANVKSPIAVRYNWIGAPSCNLYNSDNLPTSPFRTDDWPGATDSQLVPIMK